MTRIDLSVLTSRQREVYLAHQDGASFSEIAKQIGVSKGSVSNVYKRAVKALNKGSSYAPETPPETPRPETPPRDPETPLVGAGDGYVDPWRGVTVGQVVEGGDGLKGSPPETPPRDPPETPLTKWVEPGFDENATFVEKYTAELPPAKEVNASRVPIMGGGGHDWSQAPDFDQAKEQAAGLFEWAFMTDLPIEQADKQLVIVSAKLPEKSVDRLGKAAAPVLYRFHRAVGNNSGPVSELANLGLVGLSIKSEIMSSLSAGTLEMTARPATDAEAAAIRGEGSGQSNE